MNMNKFREFWEEFNKSDDEKLSRNQLYRVRQKLGRLDNEKVPYSGKIRALQHSVPKLRTEWKAERVVRTEDKRSESLDVKNDAAELGFTRFKIMLSNRACKICNAFTDHGNKVFEVKDLKRNGWSVPPIHPQCNCILIPIE